MGGPDRSWGGREIEARPARVALGEGWRGFSGRYGGGKIERDLARLLLLIGIACMISPRDLSLQSWRRQYTYPSQHLRNATTTTIWDFLVSIWGSWLGQSREVLAAETSGHFPDRTRLMSVRLTTRLVSKVYVVVSIL